MVWFNVSGLAGRWLAGNWGTSSRTEQQGMWPSVAPHILKQSRDSRTGGAVSEQGPEDVKGALPGNLPCTPWPGAK